MIKTQNYRFLICLALFALAACSGAKKEEAADEGVATVLPDEKNEVTVLPLKRQIFNHELVSNGKIVAFANTGNGIYSEEHFFMVIAF